MPREGSSMASQSQGLTLEAIRPLFPLLERNSAGSILVDEASRLIWINACYCRLLGIDDPARVIGRPGAEVIPQNRMHEVVRSGR
ncbi:MAG: AAA family ATPase, partial [Halomonas sp.]|nr:AAA family ATPase [Halomonas sp.]